MTDEETARCMGTVAAELAAVRRRIGCLETKIETCQRVLAQAGRALGSDEGFPDTLPSVADLEQLRSEMNEARTRRHKLTTRMRDWGVIE